MEIGGGRCWLSKANTFFHPQSQPATSITHGQFLCWLKQVQLQWLRVFLVLYHQLAWDLVLCLWNEKWEILLTRDSCGQLQMIALHLWVTPFHPSRESFTRGCASTSGRHPTRLLAIFSSLLQLWLHLAIFLLSFHYTDHPGLWSFHSNRMHQTGR